MKSINRAKDKIRSVSVYQLIFILLVTFSTQFALAKSSSEKVTCYKYAKGKYIEKSKKRCKGKYSDTKDGALKIAGEKYTKKINKYIKRKKFVLSKIDSSLTTCIGEGTCTKKEYDKIKSFIKKNKSQKDKSAKYTKKMNAYIKRKKIDVSTLDGKLSECLKTENCTKYNYKDFKSFVKKSKKKNKKSKKFTSKINKIIARAKKKSFKDSDIPESITKCLASSSCQKPDYTVIKRLIKDQKRKGKSAKYCGSKFTKYLAKIPMSNPRKEVFLKASDPSKEYEGCTKDLYKEIKCLAKGKAWITKKDSGKYKCMKSNKLAFDLEFIKVKVEGKLIRKCRKLTDKFKKKKIIKDGVEYYRFKHIKRLKKAKCLDYNEKKAK
ncbi:MAG: hypothetical protein ACI9QD_000224 [Thermoproteota archaeon]|jgi:hypothetical protein